MNGTETKISNGAVYSYLRNSVRVGRSTMVISHSGGFNGIRYPEKTGQNIHRRRKRFHPVSYMYRGCYVVGILAIVSGIIHWG